MANRKERKMRAYHKRKKRLTILMAVLFTAVTVSQWAFPVYAASGSIYTCTITPSYSHPITGTIEDSGGESSKTTGQGMVEGAVTTTGMLEVTDSGSYYLTVRMGLIDYSQNHSFSVQNVGDSGWSQTTGTVTGNGTDGSGTTSDICIQVPSESCIVRVSMYVSPMGRDVIFFFYPSNYKAGNSSGMKATMVTEDSQGNQSTSSSESGSSNNTADTQEAGTAGTDSANAQAGTAAGAAQEQSETGNGQEAADASLNDAQGLSLSTAPESVETESEEQTEQTGLSPVSLFFALTLSLTISGLILLGAGAGVVYYFRKNWKRWGDDDDEEEDEEDEQE